MRNTLPILGQHNPSQSKVQSVQTLINFYLEEDRERGRFIAFGTPGYTTWVDLSGSVIRGMKEHKGFGYVVKDATVYKVTDATTQASIGTLNTATGRVSIVALGDYVCFADGADVWKYKVSTSSWGEVVDADLVDNVAILAALNDYLLIVEPDSYYFWSSNLSDPTTIGTNAYAAADVKFDNLVSAATSNSFLWLFCETSTEIWYNSGAETIAFDRAVAGALNYGCAAAFTPQIINDAVYWLAQDENGVVGVVRASGNGSVEVLSSRAMIHQIQNYIDLSDSFAWTYQENGHVFYLITFPTASTNEAFDTIGETWAFDVTTQLWSLWQSADTTALKQPEQSRYRANCHMYLNGQHLIGDYESGKIFVMSPSVYTEDGTEIVRQIRTSHYSDNDTMIALHNVVVETESGVGLTSGQGSDPQIMLRYSKDKGRTWSDEIWRSSGKVGEYRKRTMWNRIGSARSITLELNFSDPIKWVILGATALIDVEEPKSNG